MTDTPPEKTSSEASSQSQTSSESTEKPRRSFIKEATALLAAFTAFLVPLGSGIAFFLTPLLKKKNASEDRFLKVTTLDAIPQDGTAQRFAVVAPFKKDGWNTFTNLALGSVYLSKQTDGKILALNSECPHAGCSVHSTEKGFHCPCHNAIFGQEGDAENTVSPRDLDTLIVEVRNKNEVWVEFKSFRTGTSDKNCHFVIAPL